MSIAEARRKAAQEQILKVILMNDPFLIHKPDYFPGKSKPVSKRTARLWRGATITFR